MGDKDITNDVEFELNDDDCLPLTKCVCGKTFGFWNFVLGMDGEDCSKCPECKREMYFLIKIMVFEKESVEKGEKE